LFLQSLKSFTFTIEGDEECAIILACLSIPSLEHLELRWCSDGGLDEALDNICGDETIQVRRLALHDYLYDRLRTTVYAKLNYFKHLETLVLMPGSHDELLIALSPQLQTVVLFWTDISLGVLVDFVQRRVL
jgi:hypothetical protein